MEERIAESAAEPRPGHDPFSVCPVPDWVVHEPYETSAADADKFVIDGACLLLSDRQQDLCGSRPAWHMRIAHRVVTASGASAVAQFSVAFDPMLQDLTVHWIRVIRDGVVVEHARAEAFQLMRREQAMEWHVLDGRLSATLVMSDVRTGDIVERCWTVSGESPVLRGAFGDWLSFGGAPAVSVRYRLRTPKHRSVATRSFADMPEAVVVEENGILDRRWRVDLTPRTRFEDYTPPWRQLSRSLQVSEPTSWSRVSSLFAPHYSDQTYPPEIKDEAGRICTEFSDPGDRLIAALASVQRRLRYLSLSLGDGGLVPRPLSEIWSTGYGDCKDSSRLFVALARLCGLDACPALVTTTYGPAVDEWLPSATVFDHCISRVALDGKVWWIDPTRRSHAAKLEHLMNPHFGWALPLTAQGCEIEDMGFHAPHVLIDTAETIEFSNRIAAPALLALRERHGGLAADWLLEQVANNGLSGLEDELKRRYQPEWPHIAVKEPLKLQEDKALHLVTLDIKFSIEEPWTSKENGIVTCALCDHTLHNELGVLALTAGRKNEVYLGRPRTTCRRLEIKLPIGWNASASEVAKEIPGARYTESITVPDPKRIVLEQKLVVSAATTPAAEAPGYAALAKAITECGLFRLSNFSNGETFQAPAAEKKPVRVLIAALVFLVLWLIAQSLRDADNGLNDEPINTTGLSGQYAPKPPGH